MYVVQCPLRRVFVSSPRQTDFGGQGSKRTKNILKNRFLLLERRDDKETSSPLPAPIDLFAIYIAKRWLTRSVGIFYRSRIDDWCRDSGSTSPLKDRTPRPERWSAGTKCPGTSRLGTCTGQQATSDGEGAATDLRQRFGDWSTTGNDNMPELCQEFPKKSLIKEPLASVTLDDLATPYPRIHLGEFGEIG